LETRFVLETRLLLKHCQLATLSFCVCRPTVCCVRDLKDEARFSFMLLETV